MTRIFLLVSLLVFSSACIKTAEQVNRERRFEQISEQMGDTQGLLANIVTQMKDMQTQLDRMNGRLEELEHKQSQINPEQINKMNESLEVMKAQKDTDSQTLAQIQAELKEHRLFMEKVTSTLASLKDKPAPQSKKKSAKEELENGLNLIKADKYAEARKELEPLIDHPDLTAGEKNKVLHGLGKVEYYTGNNEKALVYFSKIITKYPRASLAPSSLLFIGRALEKMGKKEEAREAFQKVVDDYKGTKEANEAKKRL